MIAVFLVGVTIGTLLAMFIIGATRTDHENEIYMEGYLDGMRAKENEM